MNQDILKLISFQSFFLVNNVGRNIVLDTNDTEELQFFFKIYQYFIFDLIKFLNVSYKKKLDSNLGLEELRPSDMFIIYNYMIDFISNKKYLYDSFKLN
jgi:hypothetical protein